MSKLATVLLHAAKRRLEGRPKVSNHLVHSERALGENSMKSWRAPFCLLFAAASLQAGTSHAATAVLTSTQDTFIMNNAASSNLGNLTRFAIEGDISQLKRSLLLFDLSSIPAGATITSATLTLEKISSDIATDSISVHAITRSWVEGDGTAGSGTTWNTYDGASSWTTGGGDFNVTASATTVVTAAAGPQDWDLTSLVQDWVDSVQVNYGVLLKREPEAKSAQPLHYFSSRELTPAPQLTVVYSLPMPDITVLKSVTAYSDPVNNQTNPKAIPGAVMLYTLVTTNAGPGTADADTTVLTDLVPANTDVFVGDIDGPGSGPVRFADGATSSALTFTFTSLASSTDDVAFSNDSGATYTYTPVPDGSGFDSAVTHLRINPQGVFAAASGGNNPSFSLEFQVRVD